MGEKYKGYEIRYRPGWTGGVTAAVYHDGRFLQTLHAGDKRGAQRKARRFVDHRQHATGGEANG